MRSPKCPEFDEVYESMKALGLKELSKSSDDIVYEGYVDLCKKLKHIPTIKEVSKHINFKITVIHHVVGRLVDNKRLKRLNRGIYLPIIKTSSDSKQK